MNSLDKLYDQWWRHSMNTPPTDDLLHEVRSVALKQTHDEDVAQAVCVVVLEKLQAFRRADLTAFSRWVRSIIRRTRLDMYRTSSNHTKEFDETAQPLLEDDQTFVNISQLPDDIQAIAAKMLAGYSLREIADRLEMNDAALRNKLARFRESSLRNAARKPSISRDMK